MSTAYAANSTDITTYWLAIVASTNLPDTTGVAFNAAGLTLHYNRIRAAEASAVTAGSPAPVTLAADDTAHTDWGFRHIGNGVHRVDWPDAAFATGSAGVTFHVGGVTDRVFVLLPLVDITGSDPRAAVTGDLSTIEGKIDTIDNLLDTEMPALTASVATLQTTANTIDGRLDTEIPALVSAVAAVQTAVDTVDNLLDTEMPALTTAVATLQTSVTTIDDLLDTEIGALTTAVAAVPAAVVAAEIAALDGFARAGTNGNGTLTVKGTTYDITTNANAAPITAITARVP